MEIRDAVEGDAAAMAAIADAPTDVMVNLVHDRTVRVAEPEPVEDDPNEDVEERAAGTDETELLGFVSYDARQDAVHVTQLEGTGEACERLLAEPVRFADGEDMSVELLVPDPGDAVADAAEDVGFHEAGSGPRFEGQPTTRYRLDP